MDSFILIPPGPEVSGRGAGIHPGRANKHHHGYAGRYHHSAAGCPGAEGSCLATLKANISAPFRSDSKFGYMLKSHLKGGKRVSSDQPGLKKTKQEGYQRSRLQLAGEPVRNVSTHGSLA